MIGEHCGQRVVPRGDNPFYFRRKCLVCGRIFKQRKRQPAKSRLSTLIERIKSR